MKTFKIIYKNNNEYVTEDESVAQTILDSQTENIKYAYDKSWALVYTYKSDLRVNEEINRAIYSIPYPEYDKTSIAQAWRNSGWSFLQHLASALFSADRDNDKKIRSTFRNYIEEYKDDIDIIEENAWIK